MICLASSSLTPKLGIAVFGENSCGNRIHFTIFFHGILAPHAKARSKLVPAEKSKETGDLKVPMKARVSWANLLKRVFGIDRESCECCGKTKLLSAIMETAAIEKILKHLGRPYKPPNIALATYPEQASLEF